MPKEKVPGARETGKIARWKIELDVVAGGLWLNDMVFGFVGANGMSINDCGTE